jgi:hypothetical protein
VFILLFMYRTINKNKNRNVALTLSLIVVSILTYGIVSNIMDLKVIYAVETSTGPSNNGGISLLGNAKGGDGGDGGISLLGNAKGGDGGDGGISILGNAKGGIGGKDGFSVLHDLGGKVMNDNDETTSNSPSLGELSTSNTTSAS